MKYSVAIKLTLASACILSYGVHAGVVVGVTDVGSPTQSGQSLLAYRGFRLSASTDDGSLLTAIDLGGSSGANPAQGLSGSFLQRGILGVGGGGGQTFTLTPQSAVIGDFDSHLLTAAASRLDLSAPAETNDRVNPFASPADTATSDYGLGNRLTGTFGVAVASRSTAMDLAYVVVPVGATVSYRGSFATTVSPAAVTLSGSFSWNQAPGAWSATGGGSWNAGGNFVGGAVPNSAASVAFFGSAIAAPSTVILGSPVTVGLIGFASPQSYTVGGTALLTLNAGATGPAYLVATSGSHNVSAPLALTSASTVIQVSVGSTLTTSTLSATGSVAVSGGGSLVTATGVLAATSLTVAVDGSRVRIGTGAVLSGQSITDVRSLVASGLTSGGAVGLTALGVGDARDGFARLAVISNEVRPGVAYFETFFGRAVSSADVLVRYTYTGDTDFDGTLTGNDLANLIEGLSTGQTGWANGDFDYNGVVNSADLALFNNALANLGASFGSPAITEPTGGGVVPEPAALGMALGLMPVLVLRRRRGASVGGDVPKRYAYDCFQCFTQRGVR